MDKCVTVKKTGRCSRRCCPEDGGKWPGRQVRSHDCVRFRRLTLCCVCYCCIWRGVTRCERPSCALTWRTGPTFRTSLYSNACATARSGYVCCVSNCFGKTSRVITDAAIVRDLRQRGAILVGKTHCTAFAYRTPAPTRNPHDLNHTPGGSSSGPRPPLPPGWCPLLSGLRLEGQYCDRLLFVV